MSQTTITYGMGAMYTALIPPKAMEHIKEDPDKVSGFGLTPAFFEVPEIVVVDLIEAGLKVPAHWSPFNKVMPFVHGIAFYLVPHFSRGMALSVAMKKVNLRTGLPEPDFLTKDPRQSFWSECPSWIDGYVAPHSKGVRQFYPLKTDAERKADIAAFVGIRPDDPWYDAITSTFYLPKDQRKIQADTYRMWGGEEMYSLDGFEKGTLSLASNESAPADVGMGAGAIMLQEHPEDLMAKIEDYDDRWSLGLTIRMVWHEWYNQAAAVLGVPQITFKVLKDLENRQEEYERSLWRRLNVAAVSNVGNFPMP